MKNIPILELFGDNIAAGSFPLSPLNCSASLSAAQTFVQMLENPGADAKLAQLPDIGIKGNSHMMMKQDKNNLAISSFSSSGHRSMLKTLTAHAIETVA